jgi:8-oxo-dGTP pyrophosphatase MutT (NUDIX family)
MDVERPPIGLDQVRRAIAAAPEPALVRLSTGPVVGLAGVLVPVFEDGGDTWVLMTRRAQWLRRNGGDVSFPGGRQDEGEDIVATALREAHEEVGLDPARVEVIGQLDHTITLAGIEMVPLVGVLDGPPDDLVVSTDEVEAVLMVRVRDLLVADHYRGERWTGNGPERDMHEFDLEGDTVWGATARILHRFLELVVGAGPSGGLS